MKAANCTVLSLATFLGAGTALFAQTSVAAGLKADLQPAQKQTGTSIPVSNASCDPGPTALHIPLDASFSIVDFNFGSGACERNDDGVSSEIPLAFTFNLFGDSYNSIWINNNGNVTFDNPFGTFTPSGFPLTGAAMVAPFWSDVDTRGGGGTVWMRSESNRFVVVWERVGYFNSQTDRLNTYQVIITNGADATIGLGNNVCFGYDDMQWTTGDASGGSGGFGGVPATAGANRGDGVQFFQVGRFDEPGDAFDGPTGDSDGVDFLDDSTIAFSTAGSNVPPIFTDSPTALTVSVGESLQFDVTAIAPETTQIVTLSANTSGLANFGCTFVAGKTASGACTFDPMSGQEGQHVVIFTASDDGTPPATSDLTLTIEVVPGSAYCFAASCPCGNDTAAETGCLNSTGSGAELTGSGSASVAADDLVLTVQNLPLGRFGVVFMGPDQDCTALGDGLRGVLPGPPATTYIRYPIRNAGGAGTFTEGPGIAAFSLGFGSNAILAGSTWNFQAIYRDQAGPCGTQFNLSNAYTVDFVP